MTALAAWQNFYVIVGSSAGALTGLQFVVMAFMADLPITPGTAQTADAFATPTVVHFGTALLLSGLLCAPWSGMGAPLLLCGLCGVTGFAYAIVVFRRMRGQTVYQLVIQDWLWYVVLPALAYGILAGAAYAARFYAGQALFGVAAAALSLLFIGIHNAWDTVTYLIFVRKQEQHDNHAA